MVGTHIHHGIQQGDKHPRMRVALERVIQLPQRFGRTGVTRRNLTKRCAANRHQHRRRDALARNIRDHDTEPRRRERDHIVEISAHLLRRRVTRIEIEPRDRRRIARQQHLLNTDRERQIDVHLTFLDLHREQVGIVQRQRGLLGERFQEDEIVLGKRSAVGRVGHREHTEEALAKTHGHRDHRANRQRRIFVSHDTRIGFGICDELSLPACHHRADDAFVIGKLLRFQHLFDEARSCSERVVCSARQRTMRWEKSFDRHASHLPVAGALEKSRAQRARAEDRRVHDALPQCGRIQSLPSASTMWCMKSTTSCRSWAR
ncbi:MAG: hypothetical protein NVV63_16660 [Opitutus sp.]|nr:hypothetical protein [Opitutus sp.]